MPQAPIEERLLTSGVLKKYTNFVNGYQDRYFEIRHGKIAYYYSKSDKSCCRGQFALRNALVEAHPDNHRDLIIRFPGDVIWYLQADDPTLRDRWFKALTKDYGDSSDYSSSSTHSHSRNPSVSSVSLNGSHDIRLPLQKEGTELLDSRIGDLQGYRFVIASRLTELEKAIENGENIGKIQSLEVRATRMAVTSTIDDIIDLIRKGASTGQPTVSLPSPPLSPPSPSEEMMNGKIRSISDETIVAEPRKKSKGDHQNTVTFVTSDGEEEFHDADEHSSFGSIEEGTEARERESRASSAAPVERAETIVDETSDTEEERRTESGKDEENNTPNRYLPFGCFDTLQLPSTYSLRDEINEITMQQLRYAMEGVDNSTWSLFAEDGEMKMFKREVEMDGLPVDPLKALHHVKGVSALEYMHYFFDPRFKRDWDHTLDGVQVLDQPSSDTALLHQKHKTIWPAAARESLFWSHIRRVDSMKSKDAADLYIVCNKDVVREDVPLGSSSAVRVKLTVSMVCETLIRGGKKATECSREDVSCRILYVSCVHPGGWVPTAALRTVYKREYPKFLRTFTDFVHNHVRSQPLAI